MANHTRLWSVLFYLGFILCSIATASPDTALSGTEANEENAVEDGVRLAVKKWEQAFSGFPMNCRRVVDLFAEDGVAEIPVGQTILPAGKRMFKHCEQELHSSFTHIETFVSGPIYITGYQVAFERSALMVTKTNCRLVSRGITTLTYDKEFKIKVMKDYVNVDEYLENYDACQFPTLTDKKEKKSKKSKKTTVEGGEPAVPAADEKGAEKKETTEKKIPGKEEL